MKVVAVMQGDKYICEVSHREIEQFLNLYYGKLPSLREGSVVDLGKGYNFHQAAIAAMKQTSDLIKGNKAVIDAIMTGITVVATQAETKNDQG